MIAQVYPHLLTITQVHLHLAKITQVHPYPTNPQPTSTSKPIKNCYQSIQILNSRVLVIKTEVLVKQVKLIGASLSEPHCYVANRGKRNALWCVRTRNFSTVIKIPSACDRNFYQFVVNLHGFAFRKTLDISQDLICWQSWSSNNSKYGLVRRTYTIYYGRTRCFRASWRICF